jgi:hypothetical protein
MGYCAMQLSGDGVFGPPRDRDETVAVLRAAVDAGVDHIDTAQTYGAGVVNELIREARYAYPDGLALLSKVAARRDDSGTLLPDDDPDELRADIEENLTTLGVEQLTAVNLRVMSRRAGEGARRGSHRWDRDQQCHPRSPPASSGGYRNRLRADLFQPCRPQQPAHRQRMHGTQHRLRLVLRLGFSANTARGDPDQPGRRRRRRTLGCHRPTNRTGIAAGPGPQRAAHPGNPQPYTSRREPPRLRVEVGRPRHRQPRCGLSIATRPGAGIRKNYRCHCAGCRQLLGSLT